MKIVVKNLVVRLGGKEVLRGVDLEVPPRTIFAIMGPSGSGKSTLLRVINRLIELVPDAEVSGQVMLDGINVFEMDPVELRRKVQMVFQVPNPIPNMSILDNVLLGPKLHGLVRSRREGLELARWALEKAQLWDEVKDRLSMPAGKLSGGQQQRLCIARALALRPEILLMDEPTANLDPVNTAKIEELMVELKREVTILLVTHFPAQASRVSDYVALLYEGRIVEVGPTGDVFTRPRQRITEMYLTGRI